MENITFGFQSLPLELRQQIYKTCMDVDSLPTLIWYVSSELLNVYSRPKKLNLVSLLAALIE